MNEKMGKASEQTEDLTLHIQTKRDIGTGLMKLPDYLLLIARERAEELLKKEAKLTYLEANDNKVEADRDLYAAILQQAPQPVNGVTPAETEWMKGYREWWLKRLYNTGLRETLGQEVPASSGTMPKEEAEKLIRDERWKAEAAMESLRQYNALIEKIQKTVHEFFGDGERWSDFDVLDQGVAEITKKAKYNASIGHDVIAEKRKLQEELAAEKRRTAIHTNASQEYWNIIEKTVKVVENFWGKGNQWLGTDYKTLHEAVAEIAKENKDLSKLLAAEKSKNVALHLAAENLVHLWSKNSWVPDSDVETQMVEAVNRISVLIREKK